MRAATCGDAAALPCGVQRCLGKDFKKMPKVSDHADADFGTCNREVDKQ